MKREKKYHTESQVIHLWAQNTEKSYTVRASTSRDGYGNVTRIFSTGDTLYSYGKHYAIARHVTNAKGVHAILFNSSKSTVTTESQKRDARRAIKEGTPVFHVENVTPGMESANWSAFERDARATLESMRAAKGKQGHYAGLYAATVTAANEYAKFFALPGRLKISKAVQTELEAARAVGEQHDARVKVRYEAKRARDNARYAAMDAARTEQRRIDTLEYPARLAAWYEGNGTNFPRNPALDIYAHSATVLRKLSPTVIETSQGAQIPYNAGKRLFAEIQARIASNTSHRPGDFRHGESKVGAFEVQAIDVQTRVLRVGCHTIGFDAIFDFAQRENWIERDTPASVEGDFEEATRRA